MRAVSPPYQRFIAKVEITETCWLPSDMVLDHLCRVRHCVNPLHLEPVTAGENVRRGEGAALKAPGRSRSNPLHERPRVHTREHPHQPARPTRVY